MKTPDDVSATVRLKALGWGASRTRASISHSLQDDLNDLPHTKVRNSSFELVSVFHGRGPAHRCETTALHGGAPALAGATRNG